MYDEKVRLISKFCHFWKFQNRQCNCNLTSNLKNPSQMKKYFWRVGCHQCHHSGALEHCSQYSCYKHLNERLVEETTENERKCQKLGKNRKQISIKITVRLSLRTLASSQSPIAVSLLCSFCQSIQWAFFNHSRTRLEPEPQSCRSSQQGKCSPCSLTGAKRVQSLCAGVWSRKDYVSFNVFAIIHHSMMFLS